MKLEQKVKELIGSTSLLQVEKGKLWKIKLK